jgi:hypothetical protein
MYCLVILISSQRNIKLKKMMITLGKKIKKHKKKNTIEVHYFVVR